MSLLAHLSRIAGEAFAELGLPAELGETVPSQRPELAQFQVNGAMAAGKASGRAPREIAQAVADRVATVLERLDPPHVQPHRRVELQRLPTGGRLR